MVLDMLGPFLGLSFWVPLLVNCVGRSSRWSGTNPVGCRRALDRLLGRPGMWSTEQRGCSDEASRSCLPGGKDTFGNGYEAQ